MIERNTVLVLGAGASAPYGFPVGSKLRELILATPANEFDKVPTSPGSATITPGRGTEFQQAFRRSQLESIDAFLTRRPEYSDIGRHAIARCLLPFEHPARLLDDNPEDHWYRYLIRALDAPWDLLPSNKLSVITFNYDRSLELFLQDAWVHQHQKSAAEARAMLNNFPIVHVYGSLGSLDPTASNFVPYGANDDEVNYLYRASQGLRVIPEGRGDSPEFEKARELLENAEALCFLGFGFDKTNVERLGGAEQIRAGGRGSGPFTFVPKPFAATAYGLTKAEIFGIATRIADHRARHTVINDMLDMRNLQLLRHSLILGHH